MKKLVRILTLMLLICTFVFMSACSSYNKVEKALEVGKVLGERASKLGIKKVVFDRSGYAYTGRVKSLADGARSAGLEF